MTAELFLPFLTIACVAESLFLEIKIDPKGSTLGRWAGLLLNLCINPAWFLIPEADKRAVSEISFSTEKSAFDTLGANDLFIEFHKLGVTSK